ncbi:MAG: hypothetical protein R3E08_05135 [Thiotrichaceae bacterium]
MLNLTIHLPDDVQMDLEWLSNRDNKPLNTVITESLRHYLTQARLQSLALQTLDKAGSNFLDETESMKLALQETLAWRSVQ